MYHLNEITSLLNNGEYERVLEATERMSTRELHKLVEDITGYSYSPNVTRGALRDILYSKWKHRGGKSPRIYNS